MRLWSVAFLIGIVVLQQFTQLPNYYLLLAIPALIFSYWRYTRLPAACILGFVWALYFAQLQLAARLPSELEGVTIPITGYIASIPTPVEHGTAFVFHLENLNNHPTHGNLRLMWTNMKVTLHAGDEWRFYARLKKPYGTMNPGGFDYEAYALQASIDGNGYIDDKEKNQLLTSHWYRYSMTRLRQLLQQKISQHLPQSKTSAWISALAIGERNDIAGEDWQVLRNTGTNHLMAIAGLHIGFLALVAHFLVAALWRRIPYLCNKLPAVHAGAMAALLMAFVYSAMAGFSLPSQRACCMLAIFLMTLLFRKNIAAWQAWSGALLCVLILNPLSVLTESFWLSFASVALIIYGVGGRLAPTGLWWKLGRIQWVIAVGLVPFSIWLFKQCSLISFVANSIAIPWVGFLVAPLSFFGAMTLLISTTLGSWILIFADKMLGILWILLSWLAHLPNVVWYQNVAHTWMLWAGVVAMIFLLLPAGFPGRYFSIVWMLPLLLFQHQI
jgi:competence protein ComEC